MRVSCDTNAYETLTSSGILYIVSGNYRETIGICRGWIQARIKALFTT